MNIWQTPNGNKFVSDIMDHSEMEDCLAFIPDNIRSSFIITLTSMCKNKNYYCPCVKYQDDIQTSLSDLFSNEINSDNDFYKIEPKFGGCLIFEIDDNTPEWVKSFLINKKKAKWNVLCVASPGSIELKKWKTINFWGRIYPSDTMYAIERIIDEYHLGASARCWHSAICQALCELDVSLAYEMVRKSPTTPDEVAEILFDNPLSQFGEQTVRFYRRESGTLIRETPPQKGTNAFILWKAGALDISFDGRELAHPAALLAANMTHEIKVMMTEGQLKVFMPMTAKIHAFICGIMDRKYGIEWKELKSEEDNDKHLRELGPLFAWIRHYYTSERKLMSLALIWLSLRNCLAHNDYLHIVLAFKAMLEYQKIKNTL